MQVAVRRREAPCGVTALPDHALGLVFALLGKEQRQVALVCRRWRRVYWSEPALWRCFEGEVGLHAWMGRPLELPPRLLAVVRRIAPLVESLTLREIGTIAALADGWSPAKVLRCLRRHRALAVSLSTEARPLQPGDAGKFRLCHFRSLPATAVIAVGRLHGLTSLQLDSWQLPHCTAAVLGRLPRLQRLRLRARQLPPGCLAAVARLGDLRSLELSATMELGPVAQLSRLTRLAHLALHQFNHKRAALVPPPVASLPGLRSYSWANERGPLQTPGGALHRADLSAAGDRQGGAQLYMRSNVLTPPVASLAALLDGLLPAGMRLSVLSSRLELPPGEAVAAVHGCTRLAGLRCLEIYGVGCGEDEAVPVLRALLAQATGLRQLKLSHVFHDADPGDGLQWLADCTGLEWLDLSCNRGLRAPPAGPHLQTVRWLSLGGNASLASIAPLLPSLRAVESLVLAGCTHLDLAALDCALLAALPLLAHLDIRGVRVWAGHLVALARERPALRIHADTEEDRWDPGAPAWEQLGPPLAGA